MARLLPFIILAMFLLIVILLPLAITLVLGPVVIRFTLWLDAGHTGEPVDFEQLPPVVGDYILEKSTALFDEGFTAAAHLRLPGPMTQDAYVSILVNRVSSDMAEVMAIRPRITGGAGTACCVIFFTRFADGLYVSTGNSKFPSNFSPSPRERHLNLRHICDARLLYIVHKARVARLRPPCPTFLPPPGHEVEDHFARSDETMCDQIAAGYFYHSQPTRRYRPTVKGSIVMCWKMIFPVGRIRVVLRDRRADAELRELGLYDLVLDGILNRHAFPVVLGVMTTRDGGFC